MDVPHSTSTIHLRGLPAELARQDLDCHGSRHLAGKSPFVCVGVARMESCSHSGMACAKVFPARIRLQQMNGKPAIEPLLFKLLCLLG